MESAILQKGFLLATQQTIQSIEFHALEVLISDYVIIEALCIIDAIAIAKSLVLVACRSAPIHRM